MSVGADGKASCNCPGCHHRGSCRHTKAVADLHHQGKLPKTVARIPRPPRPSPEAVTDHIANVKANPTPDGVKRLAEMLGSLTVKDLQALKKAHGIRAGGHKRRWQQNSPTRRRSG